MTPTLDVPLEPSGPLFDQGPEARHRLLSDVAGRAEMVALTIQDKSDADVKVFGQASRPRSFPEFT